VWGIAVFESAANSEVIDNCCCIYVNCQKGCAANALHPEFLGCLEMALTDADLQRVLAAWEHLPEAIRRAILALTTKQYQ
jgi:hypothetical protein